MDFLTLFVALGFIGGIGFVIGSATGFARGRRGLGRWRAILFACAYTLLIFPLAGGALFILLSLTGVYGIDDLVPVFARASLTFALAGLISALPAGAAAFFAHVLGWNRHHARKIGAQPSASSWK